MIAVHHRRQGTRSQAECRAPCHVARGRWFPRVETGTARSPYRSEPRQGLVDWGGFVPKTHRCNGMAGMHPIPWGVTKQVLFGLPVSHSNVLSKPGNSGMLVGFSLLGSHHSGLRTGSINTPYSRRPMMDRDFAITLRSGIRGSKAGVGLSERVARQHAGLG